MKTILLIGSGPIQIGQGCEFDYSGTQAALAFREEGFRVVVLNSNPASVMTDPNTADKIYIEPMNAHSIRQICSENNIHFVAPTFGGQMALNLYLELEAEDFWNLNRIQSLGVNAKTIKLTEDRELFQGVLKRLNFSTITTQVVSTIDEGLFFATQVGFPIIVRSSFSLGGAGGGVASTKKQLNDILAQGFEHCLSLSVEESLLGWKEYELEVMRDSSGAFLVVCGVENVNPMGVHTGDSVTVSPCMTLTDTEYQTLRNMAREIFDAVNLKIGGANIQFAVNSETGKIVVVEMNPRVSRSSALVSKATGYPIARIAARLAVGKKLSELKNEVTMCTSNFFEPCIDYIALKMPVWNTHKIQGAARNLGVQMKSVGEVLALGQNFSEAFEKAWRSLECGFLGWPNCTEYFEKMEKRNLALNESAIRCFLATPCPAFFPAIKSAFEMGMKLEEIREVTKVSSFFLRELENLFLETTKLKKIDQQKSIAGLSSYQCVDTCAGEFPAKSPYFYSCKQTINSHVFQNSKTKTYLVLGSGANRIGQGVEFDTSCVHVLKAISDMNFSSAIANCNPETVSTDFLNSQTLFIEPIDEFSVRNVIEAIKPVGVFVQFGGQTPLKLATNIEENGTPLVGISSALIELFENRKFFGEFAKELDFQIPKWTVCKKMNEYDLNIEISNIEKNLDFPLILRPSYVLGGTGMKVVNNSAELKESLSIFFQTSQEEVFVDCFLQEAIEYDVDILTDGKSTYTPEAMEHIEETGIHSGDSCSVVPPQKLSAAMRHKIFEVASKIALSKKCSSLKGILNIQFAVKSKIQNGNTLEELYVIEVNPRSSRSVPFLSKSTGIPMAYFAARIALGNSIEELRFEFSHLFEKVKKELETVSIKTPHFPFSKFPKCETKLGAQMQSLGEAMARGNNFFEAFEKALFNLQGTITLSDNDLKCKNIADIFIAKSIQKSPWFQSSTFFQERLHEYALQKYSDHKFTHKSATTTPHEIEC